MICSANLRTLSIKKTWPIDWESRLQQNQACLIQATYPRQCTQLASRLFNIITVTTGQINVCSENTVWPPEDGRKDARNMLRNNWLTIKSLIVASSWSHVYLLIKDVRSLEHKVCVENWSPYKQLLSIYRPLSFTVALPDMDSVFMTEELYLYLLFKWSLNCKCKRSVYKSTATSDISQRHVMPVKICE